jgi:hypothetical protein
MTIAALHITGGCTHTPLRTHRTAHALHSTCTTLHKHRPAHAPHCARTALHDLLQVRAPRGGPRPHRAGSRLDHHGLGRVAWEAARRQGHRAALCPIRPLRHDARGGRNVPKLRGHRQGGNRRKKRLAKGVPQAPPLPLQTGLTVPPQCPHPCPMAPAVTSQCLQSPPQHPHRLTHLQLVVHFCPQTPQVQSGQGTVVDTEVVYAARESVEEA